MRSVIKRICKVHGDKVINYIQNTPLSSYKLRGENIIKGVNKLELNKIYNMDCIEYMKTLPSKSVDLIVVDPPYFRILKEDWDKFKDVNEYLTWSEEYLKLCVDKLRLSGTLILYGCTRNFNILCELNSILINNGMYFVQEIIIDKGIKSVAGRTSPNIKMLPPVTENILVYRRDAKPYIKEILLKKQKELNMSTKDIKLKMGFPLNGGGNWTKYCGNTEFPLLPTEEHWNKLRDILSIDINYKDIKETYNPIFGLTNVWSDINFYTKDRQHPSQKPLQLCSRINKLFSDENDLVYIPFAGSGSDIVACIETNRNYIATELNNDYIEEIIYPRLKLL